MAAPAADRGCGEPDQRPPLLAHHLGLDAVDRAALPPLDARRRAGGAARQRREEAGAAAGELHGLVTRGLAAVARGELRDEARRRRVAAAHRADLEVPALLAR